MVTFHPTTDTALIKSIVTRPEIWAQLADDFDGDPWDYEPKVHPQVVYVLAKDDDKALGLLIFSVHSRICWEVTIMVLPAGRGRALEIAKAGIPWVFERGCLRIIGRVLKSNRLALKLNKAAGFLVYGVNPGSCMKNGKLEDFVLFGVSKSDWEYPESGHSENT
jgi:RimJ/RimL family protein N-acetyltransferase